MKTAPCLASDLSVYPESSLREIGHWLDQSIGAMESLSKLRSTIPSFFGSDRRLTSASNAFVSSVGALLLTLHEMKDLRSKITDEIRKKREVREPSLISA